MRSLVLVVLLVAAGCGRAQAGGLRVEGAVVGAAPAGFDAAVYFDVVTDDRDAIVRAEFDAADEVSLHELELVGGGGIMLPAERIELDVGTTSLQPLGSHVMLHELRRPLEPGGRIDVRLFFDRHRPVTIVVDVVPLEELVELVAR